MAIHDQRRKIKGLEQKRDAGERERPNCTHLNEERQYRRNRSRQNGFSNKCARQDICRFTQNRQKAVNLSDIEGDIKNV